MHAAVDAKLNTLKPESTIRQARAGDQACQSIWPVNWQGIGKRQIREHIGWISEYFSQDVSARAAYTENDKSVRATDASTEWLVR